MDSEQTDKRINMSFLLVQQVLFVNYYYFIFCRHKYKKCFKNIEYFFTMDFIVLQ